MKCSLYLLFFLSALACTPKSNVKTATERQPNNVLLVKQLYQHFNRHNWHEMAALYAPEAEFTDPSLGPQAVRQTRAQVAQKYSELHQAFPDIKDEVRSIYPSGENIVTVEFVSTGTAPDGTKLHLPICTVFTIENGLIVKDNTYYDNSKG